VTAVSPEFIAYLLDLLAPIPGVAARRMFGGCGLFCDGVMFGLIADDTLYLKTGGANRAAFEDAGMEPFDYRRGARTVAMSYHEIPPPVLDDGDDLCAWAGDAIAVALAHRPIRKAAPRRPRGRPRARRGNTDSP